MPKTVTLRLEDEDYETLRSAARARRRSIANLVVTAALARLEEEQFVDEHEMASLEQDRDLTRRMRKGSRDARTRKGRFA